MYTKFSNIKKSRQACFFINHLTCRRKISHLYSIVCFNIANVFSMNNRETVTYFTRARLDDIVLLVKYFTISNSNHFSVNSLLIEYTGIINHFDYYYNAANQMIRWSHNIKQVLDTRFQPAKFLHSAMSSS